MGIDGVTRSSGLSAWKLGRMEGECSAGVGVGIGDHRRDRSADPSGHGRVSLRLRVLLVLKSAET